MYTKNKNKSILLLLFINFVLSITLVNTNFVLAYDDAKQEEATKYYDENTIKIYSKDDLLINSLNQEVEYEVFEGETIVVTKLQAERLEKAKQEALQRQREIELKTVESTRNVSVENINVHTDLSVMNTVDTDDMNKIIDYWNANSKYGKCPFVGQGQAFIDASKQSGLDPIYILAHAGLESSWGNSQIAKDKFNYFGIGAFDDSPYESSHEMGNGVYEGIVKGAVWISDKYYTNGQNTLYSMRYNNGSHEYCTSSTWMHDINNIIQTSYSLIS